MQNFDEIEKFAKLHAQALEMENLERDARQQAEYEKLHSALQHVEQFKRTAGAKVFQVPSGAVIPDIAAEAMIGVVQNPSMAEMAKKTFADVAQYRVSEEVRAAASGRISSNVLAALRGGKAGIPQATIEAISGRFPQGAFDSVLDDSTQATIAAMTGTLPTEIRGILLGYSSQAAFAAALGDAHATRAAVLGRDAQTVLAISAIGSIAQQGWFIAWKNSAEVLAFDLLQAHNDDDDEEVERICSSEYFGPEVVRKVLVLAHMADRERQAALTAEVEEARLQMADVIAKLDTVHNGPSKRGDAIDKQKFIEWVKSKNIIVTNISVFLTDYKENFPLQKNYTSAALKNWYKEAMPHVKLKGGRPKIKN